MGAAETTSVLADRNLAEAAAGDESAFRRLVEPHRRELQAHCYRMLGSLQDAEDALQETLLRGWRGLHRLEDRGAIRPWLYRIATNVCLDAIAKRPKKRLLADDLGPPSSPEDDPGEPLVESVWIDPYPDADLDLEAPDPAPDARYEQREAVELAFAAALQHLPAKQRAVLILREVLGFSAREVSETLDTSVASVNSALQRARKTVDERLPAQSQQTTVRQLGDDAVRRTVEGYISAMEDNDTEALTALLADDVTFSMPPYSEWWQGRDAFLAFRRRVAHTCPKARPHPVEASAQPAIAWYQWDDEAQAWSAGVIEVLDLEGDRVTGITAFVKPELFPRFGLPSTLPSTP